MLLNSVTAGDVETVVVDSEVLMRDESGESLDIERVYESSDARAGTPPIEDRLGNVSCQQYAPRNSRSSDGSRRGPYSEL